MRFIKERMCNKSYFTIGESNERLELSLPLNYKRGGSSSHFTIGAEFFGLATFEKDNFLNAGVHYSSLSDIARSIDTFTMLCGFLANPFVVATFINSALPRFKPSPLNIFKKTSYILGIIFGKNKEKEKK